MDTILALQGMPMFGTGYDGADTICNCNKSSSTGNCSTSSCSCIEGASADIYF